MQVLSSIFAILLGDILNVSRLKILIHSSIRSHPEVTYLFSFETLPFNITLQRIFSKTCIFCRLLQRNKLANSERIGGWIVLLVVVLITHTAMVGDDGCLVNQNRCTVKLRVDSLISLDSTEGG